jgi:hypothetical protein
MDRIPSSQQRGLLALPLTEAREGEPGRSRNSLRHLFRAMAVLAVPALLAVGCTGGPLASNKPSGHNSEDQALRYTQCLQQHGVNARSSSSGNSVSISLGGDGQQPLSQQQLQAAQNACKQYQPGGGKRSGQPSAQELDRMAKFAQCMNQHGIPTQVQNGGLNTNVPPGTDKNNARQAQQACQHYLNGSAGPAVG